MRPRLSENFAAVDGRLRQFEGEVRHLYLDTRGQVTAGIGHLLANPEAAAALPFLLPSTSPAPRDRILAEYAAVRALEPGMAIAYYAQRTVLRLAQATLDELVTQDLTAAEKGLAAAFPGFPGYPEPAREALLDMGFNLGVGGFVREFPHLDAFVRSHNWRGCAAECERAGIAPARNQQTAALFLQAANQT